MNVYKYISLGLSLSGKAGKVSYLHEECGIALNCTLGPNAVITTETPPQDARCPWCGKAFKGESK